MNITSRIDKVVHCTPDHWTECPPPPYTAKVELCRTCNFKCAYCYHSQMTQPGGRMNIGMYKRIVDELHAISVKELAPFFYGESFLHQRLPDAIEYARKTGFEYVFLTTNGAKAYHAAVQKCMAAGLSSLKFSLNYCDALQFTEKTRMPPHVFDMVLNNIMAARRVRDAGKYECGLYASYILYDDKQRERMHPLLHRIGPYLDEVYELPMYRATTGVGSPGNTGRASNPVPPIPCWVLFREAHINFDGTVCACSFNTADEFTMGDLKTQSFMDIWHGEKFRALRRAHLSKSVKGTACEKCIGD